MKFYLNGVAYDAQKIRVGRILDIDYVPTDKWCLNCDFPQTSYHFSGDCRQIGEWNTKEEAQAALDAICMENGIRPVEQIVNSLNKNNYENI